MKKSKILLGTAFLAVIGLITMAADHIDAPAAQGTSADITDFYAFQGANTDNLVFAANVQGLLSPNATSTTSFDESVMVEINIDTDGDNVEDLVIQAIPRDGIMYFFGPVVPSITGKNSAIYEMSSVQGEVAITPYGSNAIIGTNETGIKMFAGPRDDPFFMDFARYGEIIAGNAASFNNPGADTFAGSNVLSIVIEVPKSMIGTSGTINTWVEAKVKQ
jgi:hypothetical protein